jgi:hypothetical protein
MSLAALARRILNALAREERTLYLQRRNERYEGWAYVGGARKLIIASRSMQRVIEFARREGWVIVEV